VANELEFKLQIGNVLTADAVARIFLSINALHIAAHLAAPSRAPVVLESLYSHNLIEKFNDAWTSADIPGMSALAAVASLEVITTVEPLRVISVRSGSIEAVFEEVIDAVFDKFRQLLQLTKPQTEQDQMVATLQSVARDAPEPNAIVSIGGVAILNWRTVVAQLRVEHVVVEQRQQRQRPLLR